MLELCGTHMKCLFTVYGDGSVPEDMSDIKNEKCRCYLKLVSTFGMNKECPLTDLTVSSLKNCLPPYTNYYCMIEKGHSKT